MNSNSEAVLIEMHEMMKTMMEEQKQLAESIKELKAEQRKLQEEIRISYFVLNNIPLRSELDN